MTKLLTKKYITNLIKLRDWLIINRQLVENHLDFKHYIDTPLTWLEPCDLKDDFIDGITEDCGTVYCAVGWAAVSNLFPRLDLEWDLFVERYFGVDVSDSSTGEYLFGNFHPPDFDLMIERFDYVITNRIAPPEFIESMEEDDDD